MRLLLIPVSAVLLLLAGCKQPGGSGRGVVLEESIERLIPPDTVVLAGARVEQMQSTALYKRLMADQHLTHVDDFAKKTGLDPRKDIKEIIIASNGSDPLMIGRGRIENIPAMEAMLIKEGAMRMPFEKYSLIGTDDTSVVFISNTIALAGRTAQVKAALTSKVVDDTKRRLVLSKVASLPQDKHVWVVAVGGFAPMPLPETGNLANLNRVFRSLQTVTMTLDLKDGLSLTATGLCAQDEDARQLHDMLRGLIGFGRLSTPSDKPEMLRFFDGIKVDHTAKTVKLNADVPMDMVEYFLKLTGGLKRVA